MDHISDLTAVLTLLSGIGVFLVGCLLYPLPGLRLAKDPEPLLARELLHWLRVHGRLVAAGVASRAVQVASAMTVPYPAISRANCVTARMSASSGLPLCSALKLPLQWNSRSESGMPASAASFFICP